MELLAREIGGMDFLQSAFTYAYEASEHTLPDQTAKVIREQIGQKAGGAAMTAAEILIARGMEKGLKRGREEGLEQGLEKGLEQGLEKAAFSMFSKNFDLEVVADTLNFSSEKTLQLKARWDQSNKL